MKMNKIILAILMAFAMSLFTACSDSSSSDDGEGGTNTYTINAGENRDVPIDAEMVSVSAEDAEVKLTRDVEAATTNVHVLSGSVEVTEAVPES